jgi:hypothetical protein
MHRLRYLFLAALVTAVAVSPLILAPASVAQTCYTGYSTGPPASAWGKGSSCTAARANLLAQLEDQAAYQCCQASFENACQVTVVETSPCYWDSGYGKWIVDGYANHGCDTFKLDDPAGC